MFVNRQTFTLVFTVPLAVPFPVESTRGTCEASGKVLLCGEHFICFPACAALVLATSDKTSCVYEYQTLGNTRGLLRIHVRDDRPAVIGYKEQKAEQLVNGFKFVLVQLGLVSPLALVSTEEGSKDAQEADELMITLGGSLVAASGVGASAASVAVFARALSAVFSLKLNTEEINQAAFAGEHGYHGKPSGVDNTASVYGGLLVFTSPERTSDAKKTSAEDTWRVEHRTPCFNRVSLNTTLYCVVAFTFTTADTTQVLQDVAQLRQSHPKLIADLIEQYRTRVQSHFRDESGSPSEAPISVTSLATAMNLNHQLLQQLTVSNFELDSLVSKSLRAGAMAAKLTGTGRGGAVIALCETEETSRSVLEEWRRDKEKVAFAFITEYP